ncbi:MAG TPA: MmgE/PrpD family protein, partial [Candidatus Acidoferrales bacterium]
MPPLTRTIVHFLHSLSSKDLNSDVTRQCRYLLLDYLGAGIAGSRTDSSQAVYQMLAHSAAAGPSTIIGTALRTSADYAALANGTAAHSVELDDTHQAGSIHLGVVMFSTAIALSEILPDVDADRFFTAVVAGYEIAARLGIALQPKYHYELGFHPTATCGVFGATVTAA